MTWTVDCVKEGGYLDLWLMIKDGKIEWKNYSKAPAIYVGPDSCHDPMVRSAIVKGVGLRLRINSSKDEYFEESVETAAKAFKVSGYGYQKTKQELLKFKNMDPIELIKKEKEARKGPDKGVRSYYIDQFDPRMLHPRKLITRNYHHIASNPQLAALFPRENLVGGTRRLKNLQEILYKPELLMMETMMILVMTMMMVMITQMAGTMALTTVTITRGVEDVMCVVTWRRHHL